MENEFNYKHTNPIIYFCLLLCAVIFSAYFTFTYMDNRQLQSETKSDTITVTDTVFRTDTLVKIKPKPYTITIKETVTDTLYSTDSVKTAVNVPISDFLFKGEQLTSKGDSIAYTALISGYKVNLDSLSIITKTHSVNTTSVITNNIYKKKRFTYGIQVGTGIGVISRKPDIYVGFGINYNF